MNKHTPQLELVPAANVGTKASDDVVLTALGKAGVSPAIAERLLATAGPDDFDWSNDDSVVVKPRPGVAVYRNRYDDVVIRTQNTNGDDDDHFAYVKPESLPAIIQALKDELP